MTAPNQQPDASTAIHTHRLAVAQRAVREAKAAARLAGLQPGDLTRAIKMLGADPDKMAAMQERLGEVLLALGAAEVEVQADLYERTADETPAQRADRIWRNGYLAAVLGDPCRPPGVGDDAQRWATGWHAFRAVLADHEAKTQGPQAHAA